MPAKISSSLSTQGAGPSTSSPRKPPPHLSRLNSNNSNTAVSTLQSSAVAAIGSIRTISSISSSSTSLRPIAPRRSLKVVLIGPASSGKTSLRTRFLTRSFFPNYRATIGADFITRTLPVDPDDPEGEKATLQIWDTAGQERFQSLGSAFYRGADAVIICFDASELDGGVAKVKQWYETFMEKAPGPNEEGERRRFCWICAANKIDLVENEGQGLERGKVRSVLDGLVPAAEGQVDGGIDDGQEGARPSGAKEPANPAEVLSRPDPNAVEDAETSKQGLDLEARTPVSRRSLQANGDASPTKSRIGKNSQYRLSRKSLSSIAAAASKSAQQDTSDAEEPTTVANGGTMNTAYATAYNTVQLSTSPAATSDLTTPKQEGTGSGLLSWYRSKSRASGSQAGGKGHKKHQSIKSIEVFQPSDHETESEGETSYFATAKRQNATDALAFPSTSSARSSMQTPPRGDGALRQRVDSTLSLGAPSVYHTPRSSTFFSASPTPRTTLGLPSTGRDDGSVRHQRMQSASSSIRADDPASSQTVQSDPIPPSIGRLKHKTSVASSSSTATVRANPNSLLKAPKSIIDLFQPQLGQTPQTQPLPSPPAPQSIRSISLPLEPDSAPAAGPLANELEEGFTLFYTSAKTGANVDRMFQHIVTRVVAAQTHAETQLALNSPEHQRQRDEQERRQNELIRRTIRIASGKSATDKKLFGCC